MCVAVVFFAQVTAVQDYVHENENRQVHLSTQVVGTRSELYLGFNPDDIYIESKKTGSAQCRATGDPHYTVRQRTAFFGSKNPPFLFFFKTP